MKVVFEDADGQTGVITADLEVEYVGDWQADVAECVDSVVDEYGLDADATDPGSPYSELVVELPEAAPIVEIQQVDSPERNSHT